MEVAWSWVVQIARAIVVASKATPWMETFLSAEKSISIEPSCAEMWVT